MTKFELLRLKEKLSKLQNNEIPLKQQNDNIIPDHPTECQYQPEIRPEERDLDNWELSLKQREAIMEQNKKLTKVRIKALDNKLEWVSEMKEKLCIKLEELDIEKGVLASMAVAQQNDTYLDNPPVVWPLISDSIYSLRDKRRQHSYTQREETLRRFCCFMKTLPLREISVAKNEQKIKILQEDLVTLSELFKVKTRTTAKLELLKSEEQQLHDAYYNKRNQLISDTKKLLIQEQLMTKRIYSLRQEGPLQIDVDATSTPNELFYSSIPEAELVRKLFPLSSIEYNDSHFSNKNVSIQDTVRAHHVANRDIELQSEVFKLRINKWKEFITTQETIEQDNAIRTQAVTETEIRLLTQR